MGGPIAARIITPVIKMRLATASGSRRNRAQRPVTRARPAEAQSRCEGDFGPSVSLEGALCTLSMPDAGVQGDVGQVGEEVHHHHGNTQDEGGGLDDRVIALADALDRDESYAGHREDA